MRCTIQSQDVGPRRLENLIGQHACATPLRDVTRIHVATCGARAFGVGLPTGYHVGGGGGGVGGMAAMDKSHGPNLIGRPPIFRGHLPSIDLRQIAAGSLRNKTGLWVAPRQKAKGPPQSRGATELWYVSLLVWVRGGRNTRDGHLANMCACHASCLLVTLW